LCSVWKLSDLASYLSPVYHGDMERFVAALTGESDGNVISREFIDPDHAITWLCGAGLADFEDQSATGEVRSDDGQVIWRKSNLQTEERADRDRRLWWNRFFARRRWRGPVRSSGGGLMGDLDLAFELRYLAEQIARATAAIQRLSPLAEHDQRARQQIAGHLATKSRAERERALVLREARGRGRSRKEEERTV
jgi:hypothetical protein